ncbi:MAG: spermine/spermidine synthase family protein [Verrucomicrobia bacterium]|nr:spermine/spermidine synthase family protein [Verrucomicrobiota bacterium]
MQRARTAVLSGILFLSGTSALLFQALWLRLSGLAFGNSVWSAALILSSFMGGLAIGNAIAARWSLGPRAPLRVYAGLELAVAGFGCSIVFALPLLGQWLSPVFQALWDHHAALNALRFGLSFLILLVPTTAMGLTLPVLLADEGLKSADFGRSVSWLYGWNTIGAVAGAALGEGVLIKAVGLWGTGLFAFAASLLAAAAAWWLAGQSTKKTVAPESAAEKTAADHDRLPWRLLLTCAGTGALLLGLEVTWFRFLRLYVVSSSTAFSIMLAVVLAGIGLGSLASALLQRRWTRQSSLLTPLLLATALATQLSYVFFRAPWSPGSLDVHFVETSTAIAKLSIALMFPVAFLSGIIFPILLSRIQATVPGRMRSAGLGTLANTIGAAIGPLLVTFVLLPSLGFQSTLLATSAGYAVLAVLARERDPWKFSLGKMALGFGLTAGLAVSFLNFPTTRDERHFENARRLYEADGSRLIKKLEGTADTLQVLQRDLFGQPYYQRLVTNGFSMSATHPRSQRYMRLFAYLPLALRPESEDALLICFGVGVTADALTRDPKLKRIDVVDISREVLGLAPLYRGLGQGDALRDPRVTTYVQDGRFFLQASPRQYDIITGEPPPLKMAGAVNLYTAEFFSLMNARLKEGGVATFWLPIYQLKVDEVKAILRAFQQAFPNASVWGGSDHEWVMMGIKGPGHAVSADEISWWWKNPATRADLVRNGFEQPAQLGATFLMDADEIRRISAAVKPLTDLFPRRLSDDPPSMAATGEFATPYLDGAAAFARFNGSPLIARVWPAALKADLEPLFFVRDTLYTAGTKGANWLAELDLFLRHTRLQSPILEVLKTDEVRVALAEKAANENRNITPGIRSELVAAALSRRDLHGATQLLETGRAQGFANQNDFYLLVYLYCLNGEVRKAEALVASVGPVPRDWFVDWFWEKLATDFKFRPPV